MHLGEKLKLYRKKHDLDQPQMADKVGVSYRTYQDIERTGIIKKAKDIATVKNILDEKEQLPAQWQTQKNTDPLKPGDAEITLNDYINEIKEHNRFLKALLLDKTNKIETNLARALEYMGNLHLRGEAARSVALRSLSRLEKKPEEYLISEVGKEIQAGFSEQQKQDIAAGKRK